MSAKSNSTKKPPIEIVFYIHGVTPDKRGRMHTEEYGELHRGVAVAAGDGSLWPNEFGGAEWGWNYDGGEAKSHKALADAQRIFGGKILNAVKAQRDFSINPMRPLLGGLRSLVFNGFGDMFYYVSTQGKWAIRWEIAKQLVAHVKKRRGRSKRRVSLTIAAHSAGSIVAFDFLYYLFRSSKSEFLKDANSEFATSKKDTSSRTDQIEEVNEGLNELRDWAKSGDLRLRRLVTFGSPISFLTFRSDALVEILASGDSLDVKSYGLATDFEDSPLEGPRWINLWDKDDPIAWPVEPLMESKLVKDIYADVSDLVSAAHNAYWESKLVHNIIGKMW